MFKKLTKYNEYLNSLCNSLSDKIVNKKNTSKKNIEVKYNDRDGHYLSLTKARCKLLKIALSKQDNLNLIVQGNNINVDLSKIEYKSNTSTSKITSHTIRNYSDKIVGLEAKMMKLCLEQFSILLSEYYNKYADTLTEITKFIGFTDFICNIAFVSKSNGYYKPNIEVKENAYLIAKDLRHPIIEEIHDKIKYVPNDVHLGINKQNGILLYGVNAVGKSSLMKSIGIAVIMAQSGFFVAAKEFTYSPYKHIFTRISNNDNIFKGQSTFAVEMSELRSILIRANKYSLILGDELCCGTETTSALSIVTAGVLRLCEKNANFIFATHLHKLSSMDEIANCETVNNYHLETIFDKVNNKLNYDRKLKSGSGYAIYGLEVAKAMHLDEEFIQIADKIRKKIMGIDNTVIPNKRSEYNSKIIKDKCTICNKQTEEIHHIEEQHLANAEGMINHYHKNKLFNLVQLCHDCHQEVHNGNLLIKGYQQTSDGIELDYSYEEKKQVVNKRKFNNDQIEIIKDIYEKNKNYSKSRKLLDQKGIQISTTTIKKIVNDNY